MKCFRPGRRWLGALVPPAGGTTNGVVRREDHAFTMIEIAIALGVIGFALVAIIGILPAGLEVQRDNRSETIINQDGTFWLEAIRNGARGMDDLTNHVESISIVTPAPSASSNYYTYGGGFVSGGEIIGLLTTQAAEPEAVVRANVWAVSGSAAEKEVNPINRVLSFKYRMSVHIERATNFALPFTTLSTNNQPVLPEPLESLYFLRLTFSYPLIREDRFPPRSQSYRELVSREVRTNLIAGIPYFFFTQ